MIHHKGSLSKRARRDDDVTSATADIAKREIVDSIGLTVFLRREIDFADRGAEQSLWVDNTLGVAGVQNANFNNGLSRSPVARWVSLQVFKRAPCILKSIRRPSVHAVNAQEFVLVAVRDGLRRFGGEIPNLIRKERAHDRLLASTPFRGCGNVGVQFPLEGRKGRLVSFRFFDYVPGDRGT
jgi:hypothetical protein